MNVHTCTFAPAASRHRPSGPQTVHSQSTRNNKIRESRANYVYKGQGGQCSQHIVCLILGVTDGVQVVRLFEIGTGGGAEQHRRLAWFQWFKSLDKRLTSYDWYVTLEHINHLTSGLCFLEQIRPFFAEYFVTFVRGWGFGGHGRIDCWLVISEIALLFLSDSARKTHN